MFQQRPSSSNHSIPGMPVMPGMSNIPGILGPGPGPGPHMMRTPRSPFPRPPFPMIHSDPGGYNYFIVHDVMHDFVM